MIVPIETKLAFVQQGPVVRAPIGVTFVASEITPTVVPSLVDQCMRDLHDLDGMYGAERINQFKSFLPDPTKPIDAVQADLVRTTCFDAATIIYEDGIKIPPEVAWRVATKTAKMNGQVNVYWEAGYVRSAIKGRATLDSTKGTYFGAFKESDIKDVILPMIGAYFSSASKEVVEYYSKDPDKIQVLMDVIANDYIMEFLHQTDRNEQYSLDYNIGRDVGEYPLAYAKDLATLGHFGIILDDPELAGSSEGNRGYRMIRDRTPGMVIARQLMGFLTMMYGSQLGYEGDYNNIEELARFISQQGLDGFRFDEMPLMVKRYMFDEFYDYKYYDDKDASKVKGIVEWDKVLAQIQTNAQATAVAVTVTSEAKATFTPAKTASSVPTETDTPKPTVGVTKAIPVGTSVPVLKSDDVSVGVRVESGRVKKEPIVIGVFGLALLALVSKAIYTNIKIGKITSRMKKIEDNLDTSEYWDVDLNWVYEEDGKNTKWLRLYNGNVETKKRVLLKGVRPSTLEKSKHLKKKGLQMRSEEPYE